MGQLQVDCVDAVQRASWLCHRVRSGDLMTEPEVGWHVDLYNAGCLDPEFTMPEDVRRYFSLHARAMQAQQRIDAETKSKETFEAEMDKIADKVTQTGSPLVARMPNGDTYVMYRETISDNPVIEKVNVVDL